MPSKKDSEVFVKLLHGVLSAQPELNLKEEWQRKVVPISAMWMRPFLANKGFSSLY